MFRRFIRGALIIASFTFILSISHTNANAASKKSRVSHKKEVSGTIFGVTPRQKKILGWDSDYPTAWTYTRADFFIRGTVLDFKKAPEGRGFEIIILPLEVLKNPQHHITMDHYKNGITVSAELDRDILKDLKKGGVIEFNQWSVEVPGQKFGAAMLVNSENHTDIKAYSVAPIAYLTKEGFEPEQIINAIKGILVYGGSDTNNASIKSQLASLSKNSNSDVSAEAKKISSSLGK